MRNRDMQDEKNLLEWWYMKIGIYDPYLDDLGGGEKYMMTIAECLAKQHDVSVFWDTQKDMDDLRKRFALDIDRVTLTKNIFSSKVSLAERAMVTKAYDAIIILSDGSIPLVFSKKLFIHIQQPLDPQVVTSWKAKIKLARIRKIFYNSKFTRSFNDSLMPNVKTTIIYPPVDLAVQAIAKENIILHVGRFRVKNVGVENYKKQDVMIKAFKEMIDHGLKNWKFVIAAGVREEDQSTFSEMQKSAKGYPIEFLINKSNDQLWEMYSKAKIYWHASGFGEDLKKHPEYAEHFGISTVEAMGAGAVPVVINAGGQKEIVTDGDNGFLWDSLEELQQRTKKLVEDESLVKKLGQRAKERATAFTKAKFCKDVNNLLET